MFAREICGKSVSYRSKIWFRTGGEITDKRGPTEELQLCCCKFLGRDYGKGGLIQELQFFVYNFWGEITVREVQLKNCSFAAANFWGGITVREAPAELRLQIFAARLLYGKSIIQELRRYVYNLWGEITVREVQLKNCSFAAANFWAEITVREV